MICSVVYIKRRTINIEVDNLHEADLLAEENRPEDFTIEDIKPISNDDETIKLVITKNGLKVPDLDYEANELREQENEEEQCRLDEFIEKEKNSHT